jgi:acetoin utilization protein AcuB
MQVQEMMSTAVEVAGRNDDLSMVEELMTAKQLRHVPVVEDGELVGIVSQRDLFKAMMSSTMGYGEKAQKAYLHNVRVKEVMTYPAITVAPDISVGATAELMLQKGIGCLPVVDGTRLVGMVTKTDLLRYLRSLST